MIVQPGFLKACEALREALENIPEHILIRAHQNNPWFEAASVQQAASAWVEVLKPELLEAWLSPYPEPLSKAEVALVMAGNIPLVGLHDLLCVCASGHVALCKTSSDDRVLMHYAMEVMRSAGNLPIRDIEQVKQADAVIVTGSNHTAHIFSSYFSKMPHIIRRNRTSLGVLTGHETREELELLGLDIFSYYGLGCRNISKIYVPEGYDFTPLFESIFPYGPIVNHHKYANNYDYNKAIYLMGGEKFLDNNFLVIRRDTQALHSPLGVLFFDYYQSLDEVKQLLKTHDQEIQCVASKVNLHFSRQVSLGGTQRPGLSEYADGVDTLAFLTALQ